METQEKNSTSKSDRIGFFQKAKHFIGYYLYVVQPQMLLFAAISLVGLAIKLRSKGIAGFLLVCQFLEQFAKKSDFYRSLFDWLEPHKYFKGFNIHYESPLEQEKILLPFHPHSIITMAIHFSMYQKKEAINRAYFCASRMALQVPLAGFFYRWQGLVGANPQQFKNLMKEGKVIAFVPGGFEEATLTSDQKYTLYTEHKGFIKYAMQTGYKIRPVFVFNENKAYPTIDRFYKFRLLLNKVKMGGTLFYWKRFPLFANADIKIEVVVANGFEVMHVEEPTEEQVFVEHAKYFAYVNEVYNKFRHIYDPTAPDLQTYSNGQFHVHPPPLVARL